MQIVPLQALASQTVNVQLGGQSSQVTVSQKGSNLFTNIYVDNTLIIGGVIGRNRVRMVRDSYLGFVGDLIFLDTQGDTDPQYAGLGNRYLLVYLEEADLEAAAEAAEAA